MKKTIYCCDRCGFKTEKFHTMFNLTVPDSPIVDDIIRPTHLDLCHDCTMVLSDVIAIFKNRYVPITEIKELP